MSEAISNGLTDPYQQGALARAQTPGPGSPQDPDQFMNIMVPEAGGQYSTEPWWQKGLDIASLPARLTWREIGQPAVETYQDIHQAMYNPNLLQDPYSQGQLTRGMINLGLATTGASEGPTGSLGIFVGRRAANVDMDALNKAILMDSKGLNMQTTRSATGWYKDSGGNWKSEIPDDNAKFTSDYQDVSDRKLIPTEEDVAAGKNRMVTLGEVLDHPDLYAAYPQFKNTPIYGIPFKAEKAGKLGGYDPVSGAIRIGRSGDTEDVLDSLVHEVQHKVQHGEGFPAGGSPSDYLPDAFYPQYRNATIQRRDLSDPLIGAGVNPLDVHLGLKGLDEGTEITPQQRAAVDTARGVMSSKDLTKFHAVYDNWNQLRQQYLGAYDNYLHLAGETEARRASIRRQWGMDEREQVAPWNTQGDVIPSNSSLTLRDWSVTPSWSFAGWHGSRHTFDPEPDSPYGRFKEEKIGTGEGAQAYGWGHYVAGAQGTAKNYMRAGSSGEGNRTLLDGKDVDWNDPNLEDHVAEAVRAYHMNEGNEPGAFYYLRDLGKDLTEQASDGSDAYYMAKARNVHGSAQPFWNDERKAEHAAKVIDTASELRQYDAEQGKLHNDAADWFDKNKGRLSYHRDENLYQIWLHPEEHELLDWDKPWSEQSQGVRDKLTQALPKLTSKAENKNLEGDDIYDSIVNDIKTGGGQFRSYGSRGARADAKQQASEFLDKAGIPGLKFLDQGSRNLKPVAHLDNQPWQPQTDDEWLAHSVINQGPYQLPTMTNAALDSNVSWARNDLQRELDSGLHVNAHSFGPAQTGRPLLPEEIKSPAERTKSAINWIDANRDRLKMGDHPRATHNYVMFHHRHMSVIDRNGQEYGFEPVDHNPFEAK